MEKNILNDGQKCDCGWALPDVQVVEASTPVEVYMICPVCSAVYEQGDQPPVKEKFIS